jgi:NAD(P)-dependent dehydrogenase (short-subunit alcohol dehydrogenase family)/acyl dehydratase
LNSTSTMLEPRQWKASDLKLGRQADFEREITVEDIASFAKLSGDLNPLHTDETYAATTNYSKRIVHGAFQVALASAIAGMYLPGRDVVVASFQSRFPAPLYYPSRVRVQGEITSWIPHSTSGTLRVRVIELTHLVQTAEINVAFSLHEKRSEPSDAVETSKPERGEKPLVVVTGARGGLGQHLVQKLSASYHVLAVCRSPDTGLPSNAESVIADLTAPGWEQAVDRKLAGRKVFALVHAAWPGAPQGSLLDLTPEIIAGQVEFGSLTTIRLGRFLKQRAEASARFIALGTTYANIEPNLKLSAYCLGKAILEYTIRLLAPEMALNNITVNSISPSFIAAGLNRAATNRLILTETAKVPLGRLCTPDDVSAAVEFLLSPNASFLSGQSLPLTGGRL